MTREEFAKLLSGFAQDAPKPLAEHAETLEKISALAKTLPDGFMVIETGKEGSMNRLLTEVDTLLKSTIERLEKHIAEGIDEALAVQQSGGDKSKLN